jgi:NDP-sugar pyrophosphorylase family protein
MEAVIMAGGIGSRLKSLTDNTPKALIKIGNHAMIDIVLQRIAKTNIKNVTISIRHLGNQIRDYVGTSRFGLNIEYLEEDKPLGTAGSLSLLNAKRDIFITNCDIYTDLRLQELINFYRTSDVDATICSRWHSVKIPYGILKWSDDTGNFCGIEEKPLRRYMINAGMYILKSKVLKLIPYNTHMDITALLEKLVENKFQVNSYPIMGIWHDIGDIEELIEVNKLEQEREEK